MLDQQQDQHLEDFETTETQYSTMFIMLFPCQLLCCVIKGKIAITMSYAFLSNYILIFCMHLFGNTKVVFFIVFNTSKLLLFCISLSCVDGMLCFPFTIQIFIFATTCLPQLPQSFLLRYVLTDLFIPPPSLFSQYAFVHPQVFSVAKSKYCLLAHLMCH